MAAKKDPANTVVAFFETVSIETAQTVLAICKGIVGRRTGRTQVPRLKPVKPASSATAAGQ